MKRGSKKPKALPSQSQTRWSFRFESAHAMKSEYLSVLETILNVNEPAPDVMAKRNGLLHALYSFDFLICLLILEQSLSITHSLATYLQKENMDVFVARKCAEATIKNLRDLMTEEHFSKHWKEAEALATSAREIMQDSPQFRYKEPTVP